MSFKRRALSFLMSHLLTCHPVTRVRLPVTFDGHLRRDVHPRRTVLVATRQLNMTHSIPRENRRVRMVKTVAVAYLKYRDARLNGIEERFSRGRLATVVRYHQHIGLKPGGVMLPE